MIRPGHELWEFPRSMSPATINRIKPTETGFNGLPADEWGCAKRILRGPLTFPDSKGENEIYILLPPQASA